MKYFLVISLLVASRFALAAPAPAPADGAFNCDAFVMDMGNGGALVGPHFENKVTIPLSVDWEIQTLVTYNNIKIMLAVTKGKIHTITIGDGTPVQSDGTIRAERQDFWTDIKNQDLSLQVGKLTYYVGCTNLAL